MSDPRDVLEQWRELYDRPAYEMGLTLVMGQELADEVVRLRQENDALRNSKEALLLDIFAADRLAEQFIAEIEAWRARAEAAERERDEARKIARELADGWRQHGPLPWEAS